MAGTAVIEEYNRARHLGEKAYRRAILSGEYPYLTALDEFLPYQDIVAENALGLLEVPLDLIVGTRTAGRQSSFAGNFMPLMKEKTEFAMKWMSLYEAHVSSGIRDPIQVYEFMNRYYVGEGNKRVSVMKYFGAASIPAYVTRILPKRTEDKENRIYYEYVDFFKASGLIQPEFSELGSYRRLAGLYGQNLQQEWPEELRNELKYGLIRFEEVYRARGGDKLQLKNGDAFLTYLEIFGREQLLELPEAELSRRIQRIWHEFIIRTNEERIALVDRPELIKKSGSMIDFLPLSAPMYSEENKLKIAFIYERNEQNSSWVYGHELGRNYLDSCFGSLIRTMKFENRDSNAALEEAIDLAIAAGNELIFTTSASQLEASLRAAVKYPEVKFLNCSVNVSHNSLRTYFARMYEAKFLMGVLAASLSEGHDLGYVADYPVYGIIANINAFAIGAAMVRPDIRIHLKWLTKKTGDWRAELKQEGISIISGPEMIRPSEASREFGLYQLREDGSVHNIAMSIWHWGRYYELIVRSVLEGSWEAKSLTRTNQALNYWWGMSSGVIDLLLSSQLPYPSRKLVELLKREIISGDLSPFDNELRSQSAVIKEAESPRLSNEEIIQMSWLNDNILGSIPGEDELVEQARELVKISGVKEDGR